MSNVSDRVDAALEWSVLGSFTRVGSAVRRRLDHWARLEGPRLAGRVVVLTGATSGLGLEAARTFARLGATVELLARNPAKAEATCAALRHETGHAAIGFTVADTGDLVALRRAAGELLARHRAIDVLIHKRRRPR
jgi:NADPH:quinone reductase-like Zn-dependent oxidoreductase